MKTKLVGIVVVTLLIGAALPVVGDIKSDNYQKREERNSVSSTYVKETHMVPMRDEIRLATDVYLPYEDYPPHGCILIRTPYNKDDIEKFLEGQDYYLEEWVNNGWPFVVQDERGLYASEGEYDIMSGNWEYDGYDTVEWIASQDWSNGKIATWGRSAFGINQYQMASTNPPHLSCQYVAVATSDLYRNCMFQGGEFKKNLMQDWPGILENALPHENFSYEIWGRFVPDNKYENFNVPAIHIGGWYDCYAQGTIDAFMFYQYHGGEGAKEKSKLILGPWSHTQLCYNWSKTGALTFPENQFDTFSRRMFKDMINQYTMDGPNDFDQWPTVSYYVMSDAENPNAIGNEWRYSKDWPIPAEETSFYFHRAGVLSTDPPSNYDSIMFSYDPTKPVPTKGGQILSYFTQGPRDQSSVEKRDDVLVFTSSNLSEPVGVTGRIKARLFVSSDCVDTDFTVKLCDVYPDGKSMIIADGILRMRNRNGYDHWEFMEPGEIYEIEVDLWSTAYIWDIGHKIRVSVSSSNSPRFLANPNTADSLFKAYFDPSYKTAKNILYIDSEHPSCIILPLVEEKGLIRTPQEGNLYLFGNEMSLLFLKNTIVIGKIGIEVEGDGYGMDRVEFYIDDELKETDTEAPYSWLWDEPAFGKRTLRVIRYDHLEYESMDEITVTKFF